MSESVTVRPWRLAVGLALLAVLALALRHLHLHDDFGHAASWALGSGAVFGYLLQRSRFCFYCGLHEWIVHRSASGVLGLLASLAAGSIGYVVIFGAWVPYPDAGFLPPRAHIAPIGWHLGIGGFTFGLGMALSGSCLSAHLYRLGEGSVLSPIALVGAIGGFILGFITWPFLYTRSLTEFPIIWLPASLGYSGAVVLNLFLVAALALWVWLRAKPADTQPATPRSWKGVYHRIFVQRWPHTLGGVAVGALATATYLRAAPLGVTAELGRLSRNLGERLQLLPASLPGLDTLRGCSPLDGAAALTPNALFVIGLITASLIGGIMADQFEIDRYKKRRFPLALLGGVLLGFGSMISLGCTIGTLLSGIQALSLSGWLFFIAMYAGVALGIRIMQRIG